MNSVGLIRGFFFKTIQTPYIPIIFLLDFIADLGSLSQRAHSLSFSEKLLIVALGDSIHLMVAVLFLPFFMAYQYKIGSRKYVISILLSSIIATSSTVVLDWGYIHSGIYYFPDARNVWIEPTVSLFRNATIWVITYMLCRKGVMELLHPQIDTEPQPEIEHDLPQTMQDIEPKARAGATSELENQVKEQWEKMSGLFLQYRFSALKALGKQKPDEENSLSVAASYRVLRAFVMGVMLSPQFSIILFLSLTFIWFAELPGLRSLDLENRAIIIMIWLAFHLPASLFILPFFLYLSLRWKISLMASVIIPSSLATILGVSVQIFLIQTYQWSAESFSIYQVYFIFEVIFLANWVLISLSIREELLQTISLLRPAPHQQEKDHEEDITLKSDILLIKAEGNYVKIVTKTQTKIVRATFSAVVQKMEKAGIAVHRSYWVSYPEFGKLKWVKGNPILLTASGYEVPASRNKLDIIRKYCENTPEPVDLKQAVIEPPPRKDMIEEDMSV